MDLVYDFLTSRIPLKRNDSIVVGVSAGPDSMCLLYILMEFQKKIGFTIIVAHINHNKRMESVEEEQFLKDYVLSHGLIFESMKIENYKHENFHALAREFRYKFYEELVEKYNASYLMTAHHGDDLIETILMRLVRGSTLKGYHGISLVSNRDTYLLVRPLLFVTKEEINLFNDANSVPYRIDNSNFSDKYTRNRYRKNILPGLKEENRNVHLKFLEFSQSLDELNNYIEKVVDDAYNNSYKDGCLSILKFKEYDKFIQKLILERIIITLYDNLGKVTNKHIELLLTLITKNKSGSKMNLPDSILAIIDYGILKFEKESEEEEAYYLELKDGLILPNGMKFVSIEDKENGNDTLHLVSSEINLPLYVRTKKPGDYIELKGTSGKRKVSDIFIDSKVSKKNRNTYPVVVDSNNVIVWIPKLKKSKYDSQNNKNCDIIIKCL